MGVITSWGIVIMGGLHGGVRFIVGGIGWYPRSAIYYGHNVLLGPGFVQS